MDLLIHLTLFAYVRLELEERVPSQAPCSSSARRWGAIRTLPPFVGSNASCVLSRMGAVREGQDGVAKTTMTRRGTSRRDKLEFLQLGMVPPPLKTTWSERGCGWRQQRWRADFVGLLCWSLWRGLRLRLSNIMSRSWCGWTAMGMPRRFCLRWTSQSTMEKTKKTSRSTCWEPFQGSPTTPRGAGRRLGEISLPGGTWLWGRCATTRLRFQQNMKVFCWSMDFSCMKERPELFSTSRGAASSQCPSRIGWGRTRPSWQLASWEQTKRRQAVSCTRRWTMTWRSTTTRMRSWTRRSPPLRPSWRTCSRTRRPTRRRPFEEDEAAEILATMIRQKETFRESMKEKKDRELSRGYGFAGKNSKGKGKGAGFVKPGQYRVSIEEIKRRTRCNNCGVVGHWKKECTALYGTSQKFQQGERCFQKRVFQIFV